MGERQGSGNRERKTMKTTPNSIERLPASSCSAFDSRPSGMSAEDWWVAKAAELALVMAQTGVKRFAIRRDGRRAIPNYKFTFEPEAEE
jgi:hypothetical protein